MEPGADFCLFFSTDLLVDYQEHPDAPSEAHVNDFLGEVAQADGPVKAAFNYLHGGPGFLPEGVV